MKGGLVKQRQWVPLMVALLPICYVAAYKLSGLHIASWFSMAETPLSRILITGSANMVAILVWLAAHRLLDRKATLKAGLLAGLFAIVYQYILYPFLEWGRPLQFGVEALATDATSILIAVVLFLGPTFTIVVSAGRRL